MRLLKRGVIFALQNREQQNFKLPMAFIYALCVSMVCRCVRVCLTSGNSSFIVYCVLHILKEENRKEQP